MGRRRTIAGLLAAIAAAGVFGCGGDSDHAKRKTKTTATSTETTAADSPALDRLRKRILAAEQRLKADPKDADALAELIRGHYQLAVADSDPATAKFREEGRSELSRTVEAWQRYLLVKPKPADDLARVAVHAYAGLAPGAQGAERARAFAGATEAVEYIAARKETSENYLLLVQYATLAGQKRKAGLAGKKAIELAPAGKRKLVEQQVRALAEAGNR
jgi:hypothetical protein